MVWQYLDSAVGSGWRILSDQRYFVRRILNFQKGMLIWDLDLKYGSGIGIWDADGAVEFAETPV